MAKTEAAVIVVILAFAMSVALGSDDRYDPDLGFAAEPAMSKDIDRISDGSTQDEINATIVEDIKKTEGCLKQLTQNGVGNRCISGVEQALFYGRRDDEALSLLCCRNVVALNEKEDDCWDILFAGNAETEIDTPSLIEFCEDVVLSVGPAPKP